MFWSGLTSTNDIWPHIWPILGLLAGSLALTHNCVVLPMIWIPRMDPTRQHDGETDRQDTKTGFPGIKRKDPPIENPNGVLIWPEPHYLVKTRYRT